MLRPLGELLASECEVHLIDLPGHGRSAEPDGIWGMEDFAKRILGYLDENKLQSVDILGHSFGGKTAIKLAAMAPERINRIVLLNASGLRPRRTFRKRVRFQALAMLRRGVKLVDRWFNLHYFEQWFIPKFASPDYLNAGTIRKTFVRTVNEELTEELRQIRSPVLLLWGEVDTETPVEIAQRMKDLLSDARLVVMSGKGHEPFHGPGAHVCYTHVRPFLFGDEARKEVGAGA
ncbi:MAG: alpha/beta fold hydrolase [Bdellovibrionales bacterium]|nr:alpha/beta fold hydrolase [Bdellovibrionales bacterium]